MSFKLCSVSTVLLLALALSHDSMRVNGLPTSVSPLLDARALQSPPSSQYMRRSPIDVGKVAKKGVDASKDAVNKGADKGQDVVNQGADQGQQLANKGAEAAANKAQDELEKKAKEKLAKMLAATIIPALWILGVVTFLTGWYFLLRHRTMHQKHVPEKVRRFCKFLPWTSWEKKGDAKREKMQAQEEAKIAKV